MSLSDQTKTIYLKTLNAVSPEKVVKDTVWVNHKNQIISIADIDYNFNDYNGVYVFGFGKASVLMAKALEDQLVKLITDGMAISPVIRSKQLRAIQLFKGSHPLPDEESLSSSYEAVRFAKSIPDNALVINLISGGTSALFEIPEEPLDIDEIKKMYNLLIRSGAGIQEVNTVRIAFSVIKGGKFLQKLKNKTVVDLIISDVPGDDLKFIGSGPTIAQKISYSDAFQILKKYELWEDTPHSIRTLLGKKLDDELKQNKVAETADINNHKSHIISSAKIMAGHAKKIAEELGYQAKVISDVWTGSISDLQKKIEDDFKKTLKKKVKKNTALIYYGECTVEVTGDGLGGRNQELALRIANTLPDSDYNYAFLSAGTDGIDGPTDAAGAVVTNSTKKLAKENGLNINSYLKNNDSYHFFRKAGGHLKPGPTGNNLMDLQVLLIDFTSD